MLVDVLSSGDVDGDGMRDAAPVSDLHVGVTTGDLGDIAGFDTCPSPEGDDGRLLSEPHSPTIGSCPAELPRVLSFVPGVDDVEPFARDVGCLVVRGEDGCGPMQSLEAMLKALTPSTSPLRFAGGTTGHGDGYNAGLLRAGSRLAVLVVSIFDDCSAASAEGLVAPLAVCHDHPEHLYPLERYAEGLRALRPDPCNPPLFLALAGVPYDIQDEDPGAILMDERMAWTDDWLCRFSCGLAMPGPRLVEMTRRMVPAARVASICVCEHGPAMRRFGARILGADVELPPVF